MNAALRNLAEMNFHLPRINQVYAGFVCGGFIGKRTRQLL